MPSVWQGGDSFVRSDASGRSETPRAKGLGGALRLRWISFRQRGYILDPSGRLVSVWELFLCASVLYTSVYNPLALVFPQTRWPGWLVLEYCLSSCWLFDVCVIKPRTSYKEHGYEVRDVRRITSRYLSSFFVPELLGCFPWSAVFYGASPFEIGPVGAVVTILGLLRLVRLLRQAMRLHGRLASLIMILQMIYILLLLAHLFGLVWYAVAILPL